MIKRARRLRRNTNIRDLVEENSLSAKDFIYPVFIKESISRAEEINSMPHIYRNTLDSLFSELDELSEKGLRAIALFPVITEDFKTNDAAEAYNPDAYCQKSIREIKNRFPNLTLITDVALDPYTTHGHDGILKDGEILNDETVEILVKMALAQADAGADIVAPSDMMDGRVGAIREALERNNHKNTLIMSYTAKYASCLYGPFRDALGSLGSNQEIKKSKEAQVQVLERNETIPKNKLSYQMTPANSMETLKELEMDIAEGADIVMVKPATWYLDIISKFKEKSTVPVAAYQVSGEYSMIHASAQAGYIDLEQAMLESLISIKRAGASMILSYFAKDFLLKK